MTPSTLLASALLASTVSCTAEENLAAATASAPQWARSRHTGFLLPTAGQDRVYRQGRSGPSRHSNLRHVQPLPA